MAELAQEDASGLSSAQDDNDDSIYELEYEPEDVCLNEDTVFRIWTVVPPPLEYMSSLHTKQHEISGRQVWTGSMLLAHYLYQCRESPDSNDSILDDTLFQSKTYVRSCIMFSFFCFTHVSHQRVFVCARAEF